MNSPNTSQSPAKTAAAAFIDSLLARLDALAEFTGRSIAWLTLAMVLITTLVVTLRYLFNSGSLALQESVTYMHALVFMLGAAYTLKDGGHVRVDIYYRRFSVRTRAWVDALGSLLFAFPLMLFIGIGSWGFVMRSWEIHEVSSDSGGLPFVYLLKTVLLLMSVSLCLQILTELVRNLLVLMNLSTSEKQTQEEQASC